MAAPSIPMTLYPLAASLLAISPWVFLLALIVLRMDSILERIPDIIDAVSRYKTARRIDKPKAASDPPVKRERRRPALAPAQRLSTAVSSTSRTK